MEFWTWFGWGLESDLGGVSSQIQVDLEPDSGEVLSKKTTFHPATKTHTHTHTQNSISFKKNQHYTLQPPLPTLPWLPPSLEHPLNQSHPRSHHLHQGQLPREAAKKGPGLFGVEFHQQLAPGSKQWEKALHLLKVGVFCTRPTNQLPQQLHTFFMIDHRLERMLRIESWNDIG